MTDDERVAYLVGDETQPLGAAERAELDQVRELLGDEAVWAEPDPGLQQRVIDTIAAATSAPPAPTSHAMRRAQRRWGRLPYAVLGAAAAIVLAIALGVGLTRHEGPPTQFTAALTGTALAPSASGTATMTKTTSGWRIEVQASGLPRRDNGKFYEAWLKNANGVLVPIGTFNEGTDVTLWAGVKPADFPTMTVTRQVAGAGPQSSKQVVLAGPVKPAP
ncbi:MAG TPA: anti-sigma factor [Jatrophihabitantaceae bacterium]|jgi:hypothetical protein